MDCERRRYKYSSNLVCKEEEGEVGEKAEKRKREEDGVGGSEKERRTKDVLEEEEDKGRGTENGNGSKEVAEETRGRTKEVGQKTDAAVKR